MRIDRLEIENFKKYERFAIDLHPRDPQAPRQSLAVQAPAGEP
jgi:hypothetical protein